MVHQTQMLKNFHLQNVLGTFKLNLLEYCPYEPEKRVSFLQRSRLISSLNERSHVHASSRPPLTVMESAMIEETSLST